MSKSEVPNPYELTEADAQKLGYVDCDLETLELEDVVDDEEDDSSGDIAPEIVDMLLKTTKSIPEIKDKFVYKTLFDFKNRLAKYFRWMKSELQQKHVTYLNVNVNDDVFECNFVSIGTRFWQFLTECKLFPPRVLREFSVLIYRYLMLHPQEILKIRSEAGKICLKLATEAASASKTEPAQRKSVIDKAFKLIDKDALFESLHLFKPKKQEQIEQERIDHFCQIVGGTAEQANLTKVLSKSIKSIFPKLKPELVPVGSLPNVSIDYRALHYQLSFGIAGSMILDKATCNLVAINIVQELAKIGLNGNILRGSSVFFNLDGLEEDDFWDFEYYNRLIVISTSSESLSFCKLVNFYLGYDSRFGPMVLLLKYHLTESKLCTQREFDNESFIWLIICFLQQTKPAAVLPTLSTLKLDKKKPTQIDMLHFCTDLNSIDASSDRHSIGRLVVKFLEWFCDFKFDSFLNPRDGKWYAKESHREHFRFDSGAIHEMDKHLCIVNPFANSLKTVYEKCDVEPWIKWFAKLKHEHKIDSKNHLVVLTDPDCFFDPKASDLAYMKLDPIDPYKIKSEDVVKFDYPQDVSNLKVEPKSNRFANKSTSSSLVDLQFSRDFIFTSKSISQILKSYNSDHLQLHGKNIVNYFRHLQSRLPMADLSHDQLIEDKFDNYAAYGERFWQFLSECKLFKDDYLRNYSIIIYRYLEKCPENILSLRTKLLKVYLKIASGPDRKPKVAASNMVTYTPVDQNSLHSAITNLEKSQEQVDHLIKELCPTNKFKQFADFIVEMITLDKNLAALKLSLERVNVLDGGFNVVGDFYFVVKFGSISEKLDRTTFRMVLQVIQKSIAVRFELSFSRIVACSFRFSPSSSSKTSTNFMANLISTSQRTYYGNAFLLLSRYSPRFRKLAIILRYWVTLNKFDSNGRPFNSFGFVWLIVHFLQQASPPVLPPLEPLMESGDVKSIEPSTNKKSIAALIVDFLKFCFKFDFANQGICPLDGTSYTKKEYYNLKNKNFVKSANSFSRFENPFSKQTYQLVQQSPKAFVELITKLLKEEKIDSKNCFEILFAPSTESSSEESLKGCPVCPFDRNFQYEYASNEDIARDLNFALIQQYSFMKDRYN